MAGNNKDLIYAGNLKDTAGGNMDGGGRWYTVSVVYDCQECLDT